MPQPPNPGPPADLTPAERWALPAWDPLKRFLAKQHAKQQANHPPPKPAKQPK